MSYITGEKICYVNLALHQWCYYITELLAFLIKKFHKKLNFNLFCCNLLQFKFTQFSKKLI